MWQTGHRLTQREGKALARTLLEATAPDLRSVGQRGPGWATERWSESQPPIEPLVLNRRYVLFERLGEGGMGEVFRALDRLYGRYVALKRVFPSDDGQTRRRRRLALAAEFHHLSTLRHPHVVRVFDYGFDENGAPFFTMELLEGSQGFLEAGRGATEKARVELLIELLRALDYLHRQGMIHRDVKPSNLVVVDRGGASRGLKLVDFGIAIPRREGYRTRLSGSLPYLAPETLAGEPPSPATDLFGVGLVGFELFAGHHPFQGEDLVTLFDRISRAAVDLDAMNASDGVRAVIGRLLAKDPAARHADAEDAIQAFAHAVDRTHRMESAEIRESFLRRARFRGREAELGRLEKDLDELVEGRGGLRLVAGTHGMGKSRLLAEIRGQALVRGLPVLEGRALRNLKSRYAAWRGVLREMVLRCEIRDAEAAVLAEAIPGVPMLLGRAVEALPRGGPRAETERLGWAVGTLFSRFGPAVVLLEDLHWAARESLLLLARLARYSANGPLRIFASFDEGVAADLPRRIRESEPRRTLDLDVLRLWPLGRRGVAELAEAILGETPAPGMVDFLERVGEGNPGATIEVIRDLAQGAGWLRIVGRTRLPENVYQSLWVPSASRFAA
jgi:hypothetical protein